MPLLQGGQAPSGDAVRRVGAVTLAGTLVLFVGDSLQRCRIIAVRREPYDAMAVLRSLDDLHVGRIELV